MPHLIRVATVLLCVGIVCLSYALEDVRLTLAAAAILCLVEIALALRARGRSRGVAVDPSNMAAARIRYAEQDGVMAVSFLGADDGGSGGACVVLSRTLRRRGDAAPWDDGPGLELSSSQCSVSGGVQDAFLSPKLLRLALDARGAQALGSDQICVRLPAGTDHRLLERALARMMRGVPFTSVRSMPEDEAEIPSGMAS